MSGHFLLLYEYMCCCVTPDQMSGEFLFNRCAEMCLQWYRACAEYRYYNRNMQTTAIFKRYRLLELILDQTQELTWVSEPLLFHHTSLIEKQQ